MIPTVSSLGARKIRLIPQQKHVFVMGKLPTHFAHLSH
jgi:hypothetical protein